MNKSDEIPRKRSGHEIYSYVEGLTNQLRKKIDATETLSEGDSDLAALDKCKKLYSEVINELYDLREQVIASHPGMVVPIVEDTEDDD